MVIASQVTTRDASGLRRRAAKEGEEVMTTFTEEPSGSGSAQGAVTVPVPAPVSAPPSVPLSGRLVSLIERGGKLADALKSLGWIVAVVGVAMFSAYRHFATEDELQDLRCKVKNQDALNSSMQSAAAEIRTAIKYLDIELADTSAAGASHERLAAELSTTLKSIDGALAQVEATRIAMSQAAFKKQGSEQC
jgi:hypothetical protein